MSAVLGAPSALEALCNNELYKLALTLTLMLLRLVMVRTQTSKHVVSGVVNRPPVVKVRGTRGTTFLGPQKVPRSVPGPHTVEYSGGTLFGTQWNAVREPPSVLASGPHAQAHSLPGTHKLTHAVECFGIIIIIIIIIIIM